MGRYRGQDERTHGSSVVTVCVTAAAITVELERNRVRKKKKRNKQRFLHDTRRGDPQVGIDGNILNNGFAIPRKTRLDRAVIIVNRKRTRLSWLLFGRP